MKLPQALFAAMIASSLLLVSPVEAEDRGLFRHFVSFQFKEGTADAKKQELVEAFLALKGEIGEIVDIEWGETDNIEPLNDGFTHSFLVTFRDKAGLAIYLPHPAHEAFVAKVKPHLEKVYVFDYTAKP
jgi:hypothetical protein